MSRPANVRPVGSPFIRPKKAWDGPKDDLDYDKVEESYNHKANTQYNLLALRRLRRDLVTAEANGQYSRSRKLRRQINQILENQLYVEHSWCRGCMNYLHNCSCPRAKFA